MDKNFILQDSQRPQLKLEEVGATARAGALGGVSLAEWLTLPQTARLACCLDSGTTILRVCQVWMGKFIAQQFPAFCTVCRGAEFLEIVFTGRSSTSTNGGSSLFSFGRGTSGSKSLKTPEDAHGEPLIASKSSNVVSSGLHARPLI